MSIQKSKTKAAAMANATRGRSHVFNEKTPRVRVSSEELEEGISEYRERQKRTKSKPRKS